MPGDIRIQMMSYLKLTSFELTEFNTTWLSSIPLFYVVSVGFL